MNEKEAPAEATVADKKKPATRAVAPEPDPAEEAPDFDEMDEDELEAFIDEYDLDVDLDEHKKLKAKREAVSEAWDAKAAKVSEKATPAAAAPDKPKKK